MAIRFKYQAAAVSPPSNDSLRRLGGAHALNQQRQTFEGQQRGMDRLFSMGRDQQRNMFQLGRDQNANFQGAMDDISSRAQGLLDSGKIPPELVPKVRGLIQGRNSVLGSGYNETQMQEYLKGYNEQLNGILSQVPPDYGTPTRDDQLKDWLGPNYDTLKNQPWVPDGKGGFVIAEVPQGKPKTAAEAFAADPKLANDYVTRAEKIISGGGAKALTSKDQPRVNRLAQELWAEDQKSLYSPPEGTINSATGNQYPSGGRGVPGAYMTGPSGIHEFSRGGLVPGYGNEDTVPALLTPGEVVIPKEQVQGFAGGAAPMPTIGGGAGQPNAWAEAAGNPGPIAPDSSMSLMSNQAAPAGRHAAPGESLAEYSGLSANADRLAAIGNGAPQFGDGRLERIETATAWKQRHPGQPFSAEQIQNLRDNGLTDQEIQEMNATGVGFAQGSPGPTQAQEADAYAQGRAARDQADQYRMQPTDPSGPYAQGSQLTSPPPAPVVSGKKIEEERIARHKKERAESNKGYKSKEAKKKADYKKYKSGGGELGYMEWQREQWYNEHPDAELGGEQMGQSIVDTGPGSSYQNARSKSSRQQPVDAVPGAQTFRHTRKQRRANALQRLQHRPEAHAARARAGQAPLLTPPPSGPTQPPARKYPPVQGPPKPHGEQYGPPKPHGEQYGPPKPHGDQYGPPKPHGEQYGPPKPHGEQYGPPQPSALTFTNQQQRDDFDEINRKHGLPTVAKKPDFGKLAAETDDASKAAAIQKAQELASLPAYKDAPAVLNALYVFVSSDSTPEDRLAAIDYLKSTGIDLELERRQRQRHEMPDAVSSYSGP